MKTIMTEHFNSILFHKSSPYNKKHIYQSIYLSAYLDHGEDNNLLGSPYKVRKL